MKTDNVSLGAEMEFSSSTLQGGADMAGIANVSVLMSMTYGNTRNTIGRGSVRNRGSTAFSRKAAAAYSSDSAGTSEVSERSSELRDKIRNLNKVQTYGRDANGRKTFVGQSQDKVNGYLDLSRSTASKKSEKSKKPVRYNFKEVSSKILRAKTSISAGQAVIAAKRKVVEVRRKIEAGDGDPEELQLVLTHAKRMEMAARKKKHNLELEELVEHTQSRDERLEKQEEAATDIKDAIVAAEEEKVAKKEDEIFEERQDMIEDAVEEAEERKSENTEEMLANLNEMISKFGEEELKELEEEMEFLECMEIVDPHMTEEELDELKRKHRAAENRAIVKADMDYLKGMIKHQTEKGNSSGASSVSAVSTSSSAYTPQMAVSMPSMAEAASMAIDVQV